MKLIELLLDKNIHIQRSSENTFIVFTLGYNTKECYDIESLCIQHKTYCMSRDFDKFSGNTVSRYKEIK